MSLKPDLDNASVGKMIFNALWHHRAFFILLQVFFIFSSNINLSGG